MQKYGPYALVTGAAAGIGAAFTRALVDAGLSVHAVDVDANALESLVAEVGAKVVPHAVDLTDADARAQLVAKVRGEVGLLVNNASISQVAPFLEIPFETHRTTLELNCGAALDLAWHLGGAMAQRGGGGMIFVSSTSGVMHAPKVAHYAATKAYLWCLAEALFDELRPAGVDCTVVLPGMTRTPGLIGSGIDLEAAGSTVAEPEVVVRAALAGLGKRPSTIATVTDRLGAWLMARALPRRAGLALNRRAMMRLFPHLRS